MTLRPSPSSSPSPRTTKTERQWAVRLGLAFAAAALLLHVPGLVGRLFNSDEASLATMAMEIQRGGTLYHETADRKPPVVPYLYAAVFDATGRRDIRPVRAVGCLALAGTALLLALEAKRRTGNRTAAVAAGVFLLAGTAANFPADSQAAGFELFMLLPMTAAVVAAGRGKAVVAGLCLALACLCKQTAFLTALPVAFLLFRASGVAGRGPGRRGRGRGSSGSPPPSSGPVSSSCGRSPATAATWPCGDRCRRRSSGGRHDVGLRGPERGDHLVLPGRPPPGPGRLGPVAVAGGRRRWRCWPGSASSATTTCN